MKHFKVRISFLLLSVIGMTSLKAQVVKDIDGNEYQTITIGTQTWMKENLKVTHYRNGDLIGTAIDASNICNENAPKYQWAYGGKDSLVASNGRLYTWYVVNDERHLCPVGWHVPSDTEWSRLRNYLGLDTVLHNTGNEPDTALYNHLSKIVTKSGFTTVLGGKRECGGAFSTQMARAWWSITDNGFRSKLSNLGPFIGTPIKSYHEENNGYAVRCIKD